MAKLETVELHNGQKINVPADIRQMSNFVLKEQGKWFESEVEFIQQLIEPSMNCLDVGANFGIYSCAIAARLTKDNESSGRLWSYEPTPDTAEALRQTLEANTLNNTALVQQLGLSSKEGTASFYINDNPELNSLHRESDGGQQVTIELSTLDIELERLKLPKIDFIKLDAEGEESEILAGGEKFFSTNNPIVMFELHHAGEINESLIRDFENLGFSMFKLIPGLNILKPFDAKMVSKFDLNLFAVRPTEQTILQDRGLLTNDSTIEGNDIQSIDLDDRQIINLSETSLNSAAPEYIECLRYYCASKSESFSITERTKSLMMASKKGLEYASKTKKPEELLSIALITQDAGFRNYENQIYAVIINGFSSASKQMAITSPFIKPSLDVCAASPSKDKNVLAWTLELWIRKHAWSCYFGQLQQVVELINHLTKIEMKSDYIKNLEKLLIELHQASKTE